MAYFRRFRGREPSISCIFRIFFHHIYLKNYVTTLFLGSKWPQWRDLSNKPSMDIVIAILLLQSTKNRFSAIIRDNVARRHYFGLRGPTSKYYYGKAIWVRNLIFVAIFLICNELNLVYWKLSSNAFRNMNSSGGSFWPPASVISELRKGSGMEGLKVQIDPPLIIFHDKIITYLLGTCDNFLSEIWVFVTMIKCTNNPNTYVEPMLSSLHKT